MEVGAADGATGDTDDSITRILDSRIGDGLAPHVAFAMPGQCFHGPDSAFTWSCNAGCALTLFTALVLSEA
jgi:hypothetical protein